MLSVKVDKWFNLQKLYVAQNIKRHIESNASKNTKHDRGDLEKKQIKKI